MTNQKPLAGRNVGVLVYNGDEWRKLRGDAEGRLLLLKMEITLMP